MNKTAIILMVLLSAGSFWLIIADNDSPAVNIPFESRAKIRREAPVALTLQVPNSGVWVSEVFTVTAYCGCSLCCGSGSPGITASGMPIDGPVTHWIAAPAYFPFGTCFRVPGYNEGGVVVVLDRMPGSGNKIDCYFSTHQAALNFGRRTIEIQRWTGAQR